MKLDGLNTIKILIFCSYIYRQRALNKITLYISMLKTKKEVITMKNPKLSKGFSPMLLLVVFGAVVLVAAVALVLNRQASTQTSGVTNPTVAGSVTSKQNLSAGDMWAGLRNDSTNGTRYRISVLWRSTVAYKKPVKVTFNVNGKSYTATDLGDPNGIPGPSKLHVAELYLPLSHQLPMEIIASINPDKLIQENNYMDNLVRDMYEGTSDIVLSEIRVSKDHLGHIYLTGKLKNNGPITAVFNGKSPMTNMEGVAMSVFDIYQPNNYVTESIALPRIAFTGWPQNNRLAPNASMNFTYSYNRNNTIEVGDYVTVRLNACGNSSVDFYNTECNPLVIDEPGGEFNNFYTRIVEAR